MASSSVVQLLRTVAIVTVLQMGFTGAFNIEIEPVVANELTTERVTISCLTNDAADKYIRVFVFSVKKDDGPALATLGGGGQIQNGDGFKSNMMADGKMDSNATKSYLRLTIERPMASDAGEYTCQVFYLSGTGELVNEHMSDNLTVESPSANETESFNFLHDEVLKLQKEVKDNNKEISKFSDDLLSLEARVMVLENKQRAANSTTMHDNSTSALEQEIRNLTKHNRNQDRALQALIQMVQTQGKQLQDSLNRTMEHNMTPSPPRPRPMVSAFSAGFQEGTQFNRGDTLVFLDVLFNEGGNYNESTGVYTAPRDGVYVFQMSLLVSTGKVDIALMTKQTVVASIYDEKPGDQASVSAVVVMKTGQTLEPVVISGKNSLNSQDHYSTFSGYLLQPQ